MKLNYNKITLGNFVIRIEKVFNSCKDEKQLNMAYKYAHMYVDKLYKKYGIVYFPKLENFVDQTKNNTKQRLLEEGILNG
jgi:hypothetical protein